MLVSDLAALKLNHAHEDELSFTTCGRHTRKHPAHIECVREANNKLFNDPIIAEGLGQRLEFEIWRDRGQEFIRIEGMNTGSADATRPGRNTEHIGLLRHR